MINYRRQNPLWLCKETRRQSLEWWLSSSVFYIFPILYVCKADGKPLCVNWPVEYDTGKQWFMYNSIYELIGSSSQQTRQILWMTWIVVVVVELWYRTRILAVRLNEIISPVLNPVIYSTSKAVTTVKMEVQYPSDSPYVSLSESGEWESSLSRHQQKHRMYS